MISLSLISLYERSCNSLSGLFLPVVSFLHTFETILTSARRVKLSVACTSWKLEMAASLNIFRVSNFFQAARTTICSGSPHIVLVISFSVPLCCPLP